MTEAIVKHNDNIDTNRRNSDSTSILESIINLPRRLSGTSLERRNSASSIELANDPISNIRRNSATVIEFNQRSQELTTIHRRLVKIHFIYLFSYILSQADLSFQSLRRKNLSLNYKTTTL